jgi:hypothetical protein
MNVELELSEPILEITLTALYGDAEWGQKGFKKELLERINSLIKLFSIKLREAINDRPNPTTFGTAFLELDQEQLGVIIQAVSWDLDVYRREYNFEYRHSLEITLTIFTKASAEIANRLQAIKRQEELSKQAVFSVRPKRKKILWGNTELDDFIDEDDYDD